MASYNWPNAFCVISVTMTKEPLQPYNLVSGLPIAAGGLKGNKLMYISSDHLKCKPCLGSELESVDYLVNTYFESITEWLPEALVLYRIIFDAVYSSWILSLLLFTLAI